MAVSRNDLALQTPENLPSIRELAPPPITPRIVTPFSHPSLQITDITRTLTLECR